VFTGGFFVPAEFAPTVSATRQEGGFVMIMALFLILVLLLLIGIGIFVRRAVFK
jgi:hypothetical protein